MLWGAPAWVRVPVLSARPAITATMLKQASSDLPGETIGANTHVSIFANPCRRVSLDDAMSEYPDQLLTASICASLLKEGARGRSAG